MTARQKSSTRRVLVTVAERSLVEAVLAREKAVRSRMGASPDTKTFERWVERCHRTGYAMDAAIKVVLRERTAAKRGGKC